MKVWKIQCLGFFLRAALQQLLKVVQALARWLGWLEHCPAAPELPRLGHI